MHPRDVVNDALRAHFAEHPDAAVLAVDLSDNEWASLQEVTPGLLGDVSPAVIEQAVGQIGRWRRTYLTPKLGRAPRRPPTGRRLTVREQAVAAVLAHEATHQSHDAFGLVSLRRDLLQGRLLAEDEVVSWIHRQQRAQGPVRPGAGDGGTPEAGTRVPLLAWRDPASAWTAWVATKRGSVLDRVRRVSERLVRFSGWLPAEATLFVLTGREPDHLTIRSTVRHRVPLRVRSRVVLEIDPMATPAEVAHEYRRVRRRHFGARLRRLSDKHAQLAIFHLAHEDLPPAQELTQWNRAFPKFRFTSPATFRRDCRHALIRVREMSLRPIAPHLP